MRARAAAPPPTLPPPLATHVGPKGAHITAAGRVEKGFYRYPLYTKRRAVVQGFTPEICFTPPRDFFFDLYISLCAF